MISAKKHFFLYLILLCSFSIPVHGQEFTIVPLGCSGGIDDGNLSSWLVKTNSSEGYVCLDAGTLARGIKLAAAAGHLPEVAAAKADTPLSWMLKHGIKAYLISHPHFDHISGLIAASPDDTPKPLYASANTLSMLTTHVFNNQMWANFTDGGAPPRLGRYKLQELTTGEEFAIGETGITGQHFLLSHGGMSSSAFLLHKAGKYMLYMGDTGADTIEKSNLLQQLWRTIAPTIRARQLEVIVVEVSYPDPRPDALLFGHLTPSLLRQEIENLKAAIGGTDAANKLSEVLFLITHVKPVGGEPNTDLIARQLNELNIAGFRFTMAHQAELYQNQPAVKR